MTGTMKPLLCTTLALAGLIAITTLAAAQPGLQNENFFTPVPRDFKVAFTKSTPGLMMMEMVPRAETAQNWSEMVTIQTFLGLRSKPAAGFLNNMGALWQRQCPGFTHGPVFNGVSNGYPVSMVLLTCSRDPITGKPETTMFRAISGADSFYVAQYAFGYAAGPDNIRKAAGYLATVKACDTRSPDHPCANAFAVSPQAR